jgi:hypothetical protein
MKWQMIFHFAMAALVVLLLPSAAHADSVEITLTQTSQTATAGSTITFDATIASLSSTDPVFLNGDSSATSSLLLTVDDTPFLANFPLSLNPGVVSGPFALFEVIIDPSAPAGAYNLNSFTILGGLDGNASDTIGTADFSVTVTNAIATPEPKTLVLLLSGLLVIRLFLKFRHIGKVS